MVILIKHTFIDRCLSGRISPLAINLYVKYWHTHETEDTLQTFLGMTHEEYEDWVKPGEKNDSVLPDIISARKVGIQPPKTS